MSSDAVASAIARGRSAFRWACRLDVQVRKPGNVSAASPGHRMDPTLFLNSAEAAAAPLFEAGSPPGARIEAAIEASIAAAGCNTNLGIVLLAAPIAVALEARRGAAHPAQLRSAIASVLASLTLDDARATYRAIARAKPAGLGRVAKQDVSGAPTVDLRAAMALAAHRDRIARQYVTYFGDLFQVGLPAFDVDTEPRNADPATAAVQRTFLSFLAAWPDSHIVRKFGQPVAHSVMAEAAGWHRRAMNGEPVDRDPGFAAWDEALKARGINPGTSADLTVATAMLAALCGSARWHES
jgi:triphosphoribosyl-dephospho-CoA synthase